MASYESLQGRQRPSFSAESLFLTLVFCETALVVLHFLAETSGRRSLVWFFSLDMETSFGTWFSSIQLALVALVALTIVVPSDGVPKGFRWQLPLIALLFLFLSADEATGIHEHITRLSHNRAWIPNFNGHHAWVLPYLAIAVAFGLLLWRSALWVLSREPKIFWITGAGMAAYLIGAVSFDLLSVHLTEQGQTDGGDIIIAIEEWLEMFGVSLLLYAMLRLKQTIESVSFIDPA